MKCRICDTEGNHRLYQAREMMFGTKEEFVYFQCNACGCLQIREIPPHLEKFYPAGYYSFVTNKTESHRNHICTFLQKQRCRFAITGLSFKLNRLLGAFVEYPPELHSVGPIIKKCSITDFNARFLDVGCGDRSWWLKELAVVGFINLMGVDPYIRNSVCENHIHIVKSYISELSGFFSLITFHHSFEHVPKRLETLWM